MTDSTPHFEQLGLPENILKAVQELGYETPSPIQAQAIPTLLTGKDILGQAQTGTGKTAAFALPLLANIDPKKNETQVLVLAPTRELAIQVAEACQSYAKHMKGFNVLPIYGGQSYSNQLRQLKRGAQVVVGTPGRVMDHMRRETLKLNNLKNLSTGLKLMKCCAWALLMMLSGSWSTPLKTDKLHYSLQQCLGK